MLVLLSSPFLRIPLSSVNLTEGEVDFLTPLKNFLWQYGRIGCFWSVKTAPIIIDIYKCWPDYLRHLLHIKVYNLNWPSLNPIKRGLKLETRFLSFKHSKLLKRSSFNFANVSSRWPRSGTRPAIRTKARTNHFWFRSSSSAANTISFRISNLKIRRSFAKRSGFSLTITERLYNFTGLKQHFNVNN